MVKNAPFGDFGQFLQKSDIVIYRKTKAFHVQPSLYMELLYHTAFQKATNLASR
jgi:hypothetical protein